MLSASGSRASSKSKVKFNGRTSMPKFHNNPPKLKGSHQFACGTLLIKLSALGANVVSIGFQSKLGGRGWNPMGELPCSNSCQVTWNTNPRVRSGENCPQSGQIGEGFSWPPACAPYSYWMVGCWSTWCVHMAQGWLHLCRAASRISLTQRCQHQAPEEIHKSRVKFNGRTSMPKSVENQQSQEPHINSHMDIYYILIFSCRKCCQHLISEQAPRSRVKFNGRTFMPKIDLNPRKRGIPHQFTYWYLLWS